MSFTQFIKPYPDGYEDFEVGGTPVTAEILNTNYDGFLLGLNEFLPELAGMVEANPSESATAGNLTKLKVGNSIYLIPSGGSGGSSVEWEQIQLTGTKIATITIDNVPIDVYAPSGGGSGDEVSWNQVVGSGTKIGTITINETPTDVYAPTPIDVEANPSGSASAGDLTKLKVGSSIYSIPSGGSGGASDLSDLGDVTITNVQDGQILKWNSTTSKWENKNAPIIPDDLSDLGDVNISSPSDGQFLKYDNTLGKWKNASGGSGGTSALDDLTDVDISSASDGQVLKYDSTSNKWINGTGGGGASSFSDLSDVNISNPSNEQVPIYNSTTSKWENSDVKSKVLVNIDADSYSNLTDEEKKNGKIYLVNHPDIEDINYSKFTISSGSSTGIVGTNYVRLYRSDDYQRVSNYQGKLPAGVKKIRYHLKVQNTPNFNDANRVFVQILSQQGSGLYGDTTHRLTYKGYKNKDAEYDGEIDLSSFNQNLYLQLWVEKQCDVILSEIVLEYDITLFNQEIYYMGKKFSVYPQEKDYKEVSGTLTAGQTSVTLSDASITTSSTFDIYTDADVEYNSISVSTGSVTISFDAQASNMGVKVRVS